MVTNRPGLLAVARERMRVRHFALRTEQSYLHWIRRYVDPPSQASARGRRFGHRTILDAPGSRSQGQRRDTEPSPAGTALSVPSRARDGRPLARQHNPGHLSQGAPRGSDSRRGPLATVASAGRAVAGCQPAVWQRIAAHGSHAPSGQDLAVERGELIVRAGKGGKDRVTMLPAALEIPVRAHLGRLRS